jgi:transposase
MGRDQHKPESGGEEPRGRGRPTKLTPAVHATIVEAVARGSYLETAAALAGLDPATVRRWVKRGADEPESAYGRLADAIRQAQAESEDRDLAALAAAADGGVWQARAWRLERRFPDRWARRARYEHTGPGGGPIQHAHVHVLVQTVVEVLGKYVDANRFDAAVAELGALMDVRVPRSGDDA